MSERDGLRSYRAYIASEQAPRREPEPRAPTMAGFWTVEHKVWVSEDGEPDAAPGERSPLLSA